MKDQTCGIILCCKGLGYKNSEVFENIKRFLATARHSNYKLFDDNDVYTALVEAAADLCFDPKIKYSYLRSLIAAMQTSRQSSTKELLFKSFRDLKVFKEFETKEVEEGFNAQQLEICAALVCEEGKTF